MSMLHSQVNSILKDLQAGDNAKLDELYQVTKSYLTPVARFYAENKNDYEDILQDAYLKVFTYIHAVKLEKDGFNWLCKIVQNKAYDYAKVPKIVEFDVTLFFGAPDDDWVEKDDLCRAIAQFPKADKELIYKRFWEGKTIRAIAVELGMPKSSAHKRLEEIKKELGKKLQENLDK